MRHYRDPGCLDTQRIAAKLAGAAEASSARGEVHSEATTASSDGKPGHVEEQAVATIRTGIRAASSSIARPRARISAIGAQPLVQVRGRN